MDPIFNPDRPVYVIGGGASLRNLDWSKLHGEQTIAVNLAFLKLPFATAFFFGDDGFYAHWRDVNNPAADFWRYKGIHLFTTAPVLAADDHPRIRYVDPATLTVKKGRKSFSAENSNSGLKAAVLAKLFGAGDVVLLGFDAAPGHWADDKPYSHPVGTYDAATFERYAADLAALRCLGFCQDPDASLFT